jgi:hypothetical protein
MDQFMQRGAAGILVELVLDADHIGPDGLVDVPGLIKSECLTVENERVVAILGGTDALKVPLNVVPGGRPAGTRASVQNPTIALAIPGSPVAISEVALAADHAFLTPEDLHKSRQPSHPPILPSLNGG